MNDKSCVGCKFLYSEGTGYSNFTGESDDIKCAKDANPNLPVERGFDWTPDSDNCPATKDSRCGQHAPGPMVTLDVDGDDGPADYTNDEEAIAAIQEHSGRSRHGYE